MARRTLGSWISFLIKISVLAFVATVLCILLFTLANFSEHADRLLLGFKMQDDQLTKNELISLHHFYELSRKWKVQRLADKYLFADAPFYEANDFYLTGDWRKTQDSLEKKLDDPRSYLYGAAKFREAQGRYRSGEKEKALQFVLREVASDFERDLRSCLDSSEVSSETDRPLGGIYSSDDYLKCYDRVWNYDIATNKKDADEALGGKQPQPKFILGPPKLPKGKIPVEMDGKEKKPGAGEEGEEKPGGGGEPKKP
ncbi:MAG: hypothetical protein HYT62_03590 [Candidatus Yanofskybacteria bacterium]|nr:hypothetical protein [Candidatus Yanofskybacteria bacterium]